LLCPSGKVPPADAAEFKDFEETLNDGELIIRVLA
jgi:hypothetical protein